MICKSEKEFLAVKEWDRKIYAWIQENYPDGIELFADYRDTIDAKTVQEILGSKCPNDAFNEWLDSNWDDSGDETLWEEYWKMVDDLDMPYELEEKFYGHFRWDVFGEYCWYLVPAEHYLKQSFCCDVLIDTGNWNYECCYCDTYKGISKYPDVSSVVWLTKTQGYTAEQLQYALTNDQKDCGTFLNSVRDELLEESSSMNVLAVFKKFTLGELFDMAEKKKPLEIRKGTNCGLFDPFNGGGSILGIQLVEDITIPHELIKEILVDAANYGRNGSRYGIDCIYGMDGKFWKE